MAVALHHETQQNVIISKTTLGLQNGFILKKTCRRFSFQKHDFLYTRYELESKRSGVKDNCFRRELFVIHYLSPMSPDLQGFVYRKT